MAAEKENDNIHKYNHICLFLLSYFDSRTRKNISKFDQETLKCWINGPVEYNFSLRNICVHLGLDYKEVISVLTDRVRDKNNDVFADKQKRDIDGTTK